MRWRSILGNDYMYYFGEMVLKQGEKYLRGIKFQVDSISEQGTDSSDNKHADSKSTPICLKGVSCLHRTFKHNVQVRSATLLLPISNKSKPWQVCPFLDQFSLDKHSIHIPRNSTYIQVSRPLFLATANRMGLAEPRKSVFLTSPPFFNH